MKQRKSKLPAILQTCCRLWGQQAQRLFVDKQYCDQPGSKNESNTSRTAAGWHGVLIHYIRAGRQAADRLAELLLFHRADADRESSLKFT